MNKIFFSALIFSLVFVIASCDKDDDNPVTEYDYHAHIHSPNADDKHVGDTIHIHVNFESHAGETVHHVNVRIYNKSDNTEVYNKPDAAHVHETSGSFDLHDDFVLSNANGINEHTDWILEAKVWGHEAGEGEVIETVEFHVHP